MLCFAMEKHSTWAVPSGLESNASVRVSLIRLECRPHYLGLKSCLAEWERITEYL